MRQNKLDLLKFSFDSSSKLSVVRQLYEQFRSLIISGQLVPGDSVPSTRDLADHISLSRGTVVKAYARLKAEGYIETRKGSGTSVSSRLPKAIHSLKSAVKSSQNLQTRGRIARLSNFGRRLLESNEWTAEPEAEICFYYWRPAFEGAPVNQLVSLMGKQNKTFQPELFDYPADSLGFKPLRESIARYLQRFRGIKCHAEQIAIMCGWKQSLDLTARLHIERGDLVAVENPCYPAIRRAFELHGGLIYPVQVDQEGMRIDQLVNATEEQFRIVYVSPSHQLPLGSVLSLKRRIELLSWAKRTGALIFEDEHDSEFSYADKPIIPLKALDEGDQIILQGTFHKILFPSLAISYLVLPDNLSDLYARAREQLSEQPPTILQAALADFIKEGYLQRHLRKMGSLYSSRRRVLIDSLRKYFGDSLPIAGQSAGLHVVVRFSTDLTDLELTQRALASGVGIKSTNECYQGENQPGEFMLGYACLTEEKIAEGIRRLSRIIR